MNVRFKGKRNTTESYSGHGLGFDVVAKLSEHYLGRYHHITVDNAFTSPALAKYLFENETYMTGTVRETRKGMPKSFRQKVKKGDKLVRQSGPVVALKYGDRKNTFIAEQCLLEFNTISNRFLSASLLSNKKYKQDLFEVFILTYLTRNIFSMEYHENSRGIVSVIPRTVYMYNKLMSGVDIADQQIQTYDPDVKSLKLWKKILINLILKTVEKGKFAEFANPKYGHGARTRFVKWAYVLGIVLKGFIWRW
ncbi:hypothetical protein KUTeg_011800 [Tegillarca granosa]|uniref:PiggyBac transposable element-derived protein domain-containing protein n=1 Tax=Tegillarca granosa TaxID=220873 RepID=A0ABQ9EXQ1_TEGGR|nr:hypothetical protein KUTeg_011800 [Tegillarca granosa]